MSNHIKQEINKIEIPHELSERSKKGILLAKNEFTPNPKLFKLKYVGVAAALLISVSIFTIFINYDFSINKRSNNHQTTPITEAGPVNLPALQLAQDPMGEAAMIGLIVYKGKIYTETETEIFGEKAKAIVGEKLGRTKGTIDEWSKQTDYEKEFASSTAIADVYSVKGYDEDFRIMTFEEQAGKIYAQFFENLNGITVKSGEDVFGKLKITGNIAAAAYRTFNDWDNSIDHYKAIKDMNILNEFADALNSAKPHPRTENSDPIGELRNNNVFRELMIQLHDGTQVSLILLKGGYIYYGYMGAYFHMDEEIFMKMWSQL